MLATLLPLPASAEEGAASGPVSLAFTGDADLTQLCVLDADGNRILPLSDGSGTYLLAPGVYLYYCLDPTGAAENVPPTVITLDGSAPRVEIPLSAPPAQTPAADPITPPAEAETQAMPVSFRGGDCAGLTVCDAAGVVMPPYTDPATGLTQPENYLLPPGLYRYTYRDPNGRLRDAEGRFTVEACGAQTVRLALADTDEGMCFFTTALNPCYAGLIREEDIPAPATRPEQSLEQLRREFGGAADAPRPVVYDTAETAGAGLKRGLLLRQEEIAVCVRCPIRPTAEVWQTMCRMIYDAAIRHTGAPTEGDYLRFACGGVSCSGAAIAAGAAGEYYYQFIYAPLYFTTLAQETELNGIVAHILDELEPAGKSDARKITAVYQYLCEHVRCTESDDPVTFTAYAALKYGGAACQGIAAAFCRLCLELGVDTRVVTSADMGHAWNIARADGRHYYALDATWDSGKGPGTWAYFLKGRGEWLKTHALGDEFAQGKWDAYDFPAGDYGAESNVRIRSVSLVFDGRIRIRYALQIPDRLRETPGACAQFSCDGEVVASTPLSAADREEELCRFDCGVGVKALAEPVQLRILDGEGKNVPICTESGTNYLNGFFFSVMDYAREMKTSANTASMRALAQALEDYGIAAQNYFGKSQESIRSEVSAVTAADLAAWGADIRGKLPSGVREAAVSAAFEADNSLRLELFLDSGRSPEDFRYEVDGRPVACTRRADGSCCLWVEDIAANELDTPHRFTVTDGTDSYTVTASVLSCAKMAIERGGDLAKLAGALYLYNRAAENYFT